MIDFSTKLKRPMYILQYCLRIACLCVVSKTLYINHPGTKKNDANRQKMSIALRDRVATFANRQEIM